MLSDETKQKLKQRLLDEKKHVMARVEGIDRGGLHQSMKESLSELSLYDNHPGDVGSEVFERSKDFALREDSLHVASAIDDALEKLEKGKYGQCDVCGRKIAPERLEAIPYTTLCLDCKKGDEGVPRTENRPVEEEVMEDIWARPFSNELENVEFDWEDSFQEVADWNEHAARSRSGSYYGGGNPAGPGNRGAVEDVELIPYEIGDDGVIYQSFRKYDDEESPREVIDVGFQHTRAEDGAD